MTSRLIEAILDAEVLSQKLRNSTGFIVSRDIPVNIIRDIMNCSSGKIIRVGNIDSIQPVLIKHENFPYF